ncbi:MAG: hypothetical protein U0931_29770 [Vulcanimicrobiota bacterium]
MLNPRRGFFLIAGCLALLGLFFLSILLCWWVFFSGSKPKEPVSPPDSPSVPLTRLNPDCEFTAQLGGAKIWFSRKQDRVCFEPPAKAEPGLATCISPLKGASADWFIVNSEQRTFFRWSPQRCRSLEKKVVGHRLFQAGIDRKILTPWGQPISTLPDCLSRINVPTLRADSSSKVRIRPPGQSKYQLVEIESFGSQTGELWKYGPSISRTVSQGTALWCPELGVYFNDLSELKEESIPPEKFAIPEGYRELYRDDEGQDKAPQLILHGALPPGHRLSTSGFVYQQVAFQDSVALEARESAFGDQRIWGRAASIELNRLLFDDPGLARAYAETLRAKKSDSRRNLPGSLYKTWESTPSAGQASFWEDACRLVFVRDRSVVVLSSITNDPPQFESRHKFLQDLAPKVDQQLKQAER